MIRRASSADIGRETPKCRAVCTQSTVGNEAIVVYAFVACLLMPLKVVKPSLSLTYCVSILDRHSDQVFLADFESQSRIPL